MIGWIVLGLLVLIGLLILTVLWVIAGGGRPD